MSEQPGRQLVLQRTCPIQQTQLSLERMAIELERLPWLRRRLARQHYPVFRDRLGELLLQLDELGMASVEASAVHRDARESLQLLGNLLSGQPHAGWLRALHTSSDSSLHAGLREEIHQQQQLRRRIRHELHAGVLRFNSSLRSTRQWRNAPERRDLLDRLGAPHLDSVMPLLPELPQD